MKNGIRKKLNYSRRLAALDALADSAKAAAMRTAKSIDDMIRFVDESNKRIDKLEYQHRLRSEWE
ncbi:MAG: hypothetical protein ACOH2B_05395 [Burkholderiaceae bacterium]